MPRAAMPHCVLTYDLAPDYLERRGAYRDEHLALAWKAADKGVLVLAGAVGDPVSSAMLVFTDRASAEAFVQSDPYVRRGLVRGWKTAPWHTVAGKDAAEPTRPR